MSTVLPLTPLEPNTNLAQPRKRRRGGKPFDEVWTYVIMGNELNAGHYKATCYHCNKVWPRGKPSVLKAHLANECSNAPEDISKYWRDKLANNDNTYTRGSHLQQFQPLPSQTKNHIDQSLLKAWIMGGIPFEVIENPFVVDLFKELNPAYVLPSRTTLSERLLDEEVARVQIDINNDLENAEHLTLMLDGWTSKRGDSLYNYMVTTTERKEYLISLRDYSLESHTGEFLASEISNVIEAVGAKKFAAIVTDSAANCRVAREKIQEKYPYISNIRCAAHAINLIATDLTKLEEIKNFISNCGKITKYFNKSHQSLALLRQGLTNMKIKSEGLETWCQTRWGSLYMTTNSILLARPVFDWILLEHSNVISRSDVHNLLCDEDFFIICRQVRSIWAPIKECINILEADSASLADCFIYMIKLAIAIYRIPNSNQFKLNAIQVFNKRYIEFQHPTYLLCYYLHPYYRGLGLKDGAFRDSAITASTLWKNLEHSGQECKELISEFRYYDAKRKPFDLPYVQGLDNPMLWWGSIKNRPHHLSKLALRLFSISPSQASCERNFSTLKWFIGDKRTRLGTKKLEGMAKIRTYYMTNIRNELTYYGKELMDSELREAVNVSSIDNIISFNEDEERDNIIDLNEDLSGTTLILEDFIDLQNPMFQDGENGLREELNMPNTNNEGNNNMEFNPIDIVDDVLNSRLED